MKKLFMLMLFIALIQVPVFAGENDANILIFGKTIREAHRSITPQVANRLVSAMTAVGFKASFSDDPQIFNNFNANSYRLIILLNLSENILSAEQKNTIEQFFNNGGGLMALHASIGAGRDWPWLKEIIGTEFKNHPPVQNGKIYLADSSSGWEQMDEWYNFTRPLDDSYEVMAYLDERSYIGGTMNDVHPIAWGKKIGDGKIWYTGLGHFAELYSPSSELVKLILAGVKWVARPNHIRGQKALGNFDVLTHYI